MTPSHVITRGSLGDTPGVSPSISLLITGTGAA